MSATHAMSMNEKCGRILIECIDETAIRIEHRISAKFMQISDNAKPN